MNFKLLLVFASFLVLSECAEPKVAPYIDVTQKDKFKLVDISKKTGLKAFSLAFALGGGAGCEPTWGGTVPLTEAFIINEIKAFKAIGGDVIVSTGGAAGPYLEASCGSAQALATAYKKVLDTVGSTHLDIDIEASIATDNMNAALAQLQKQNPSITVSFTLEVQGDDYGITDQLGVEVLKNAAKHGVRVDIVNPMTMEFGASKGGTWGDAVIRAAESTVNQMKQVWPQKSSADLYKMLGVTPMLGRNFNGKIFETSHAKQLVAWANTHNIGHLAFWSIGRDNGGCSGGGISPNCSSISQGEYEFSKIFSGFNGNTHNTEPPVTEPPVTGSSVTHSPVTHTTHNPNNHTKVTTEASTDATTKGTHEKDHCTVEGEQYAHESNCHQYYWCYSGVPHLETCAAGTVFDIKLHICNYPSVANRPGCV